MLEALKTLKVKMEEVHAQMKREGEQSLKAGLKEFFTEFPEVKAIAWNQWIPGFNDGDPCEFTVGGARAYLTSEAKIAFGMATAEQLEQDETAGDIDDSEGVGISKYTYIPGGKSTYTYHGDEVRAKEIESAVAELSSLISSSAMESVLEALFGPNQTITATREGVETEYYDCGY